jgi:hypothetical protein
VRSLETSFITFTLRKVISAGPEGWNPDPGGATACTDENNQMYKQTYHIFNKDGVPRPSDLKVADLCEWIP